MFWNKHKQTPAVEHWAARLEAGAENEPTLALAAQLRKVELQQATANPFFKARLRQRLISLHNEELLSAETTDGQGMQQRRWRNWLWPLAFLVLLLLAAYWQRFWLRGLFSPQVDDWQYAVMPWTAPILLGAVLIFSLSLICLIVQSLSKRWQATTQLWSQLAWQGMRLSGGLGVLLIGLIVIANLRPAPYTTTSTGFVSPLVAQSGSIAGATTPVARIYNPMLERPAVVAQPEAVVVDQAAAESVAAVPGAASGESAPFVESVVAAPASVAAIEVQPAAISPQVDSYALSQQLETAAVAQFNTDNLGLAVGGAKDINNFRENIQQGYLPLATDVTVEGLFYDYYFATGQNAPCTQLFCPSYAQATSRDPISGATQHFLAVGLNSGLRASDFARKRLNLVVVLDISGSMAEEFTRYYYDNSSTNSPLAWEAKPKLTAATEAIAALLDQLAPDDQLAIVLFDDQAHLAKAMRLVGETDMASIKQHILALREQGGTNMEAGYRMGTDLLAPFVNADPALYENRLIFLTDAQPNTGATSEAALLALTQANAAQRIYTTFIGIGVDFNTQLIEGLTKIRGANYYAVHSPADFMRRVQDEFNFMVTPLLFDLTLTFNSPDFVIEQVYGSPEADQASGEIMRINTLFPSAGRDGQVKGGLVLLQLRPRNGTSANGGQATVTVTYADRSGQVQSSAATVALPATANGQGGDHYDNLGIRKGILLVRYANLLRNWINDTRGRATGNDGWLYPNVTPETGIQLPRTTSLGEWERQSLPLQVSPEYQALFAQFKGYFGAELNVLGDPTLQQEMTILERLTTQP